MHAIPPCLQASALCRSLHDLDEAAKRLVNLVTNATYVTFFRPDLDRAPGAVDPSIKGVHYVGPNAEPGAVNRAYEWDDGRTAVDDMATLVVTATKAEAKDILGQLRRREDYMAFVHAAGIALQQDAEQQAAGRIDALIAAGRHAEAAAVHVKAPVTSRTCTASEAYVFECAPDHQPVFGPTCAIL